MTILQTINKTNINNTSFDCGAPRSKTLFLKTEQKKIGMITPSSNTVLEPICSRMVSGMEDSVTMHYSRITVTKISMENDSLSQFDTETMLNAARQLADADVDVIAWNGTSGGWLGIEHDIDICKAIIKETGIPATTSMLSQMELMEKNHVKTINVITPYIPELNDRIKRQYEKYGFKVNKIVGLSQTCNRAFSLISPEKIESICLKEFSDTPADALSIVCTNFPGAWKISSLEQKLDTIVYDTINTVVLKSLDMAGIDHTKIKGWGKIFEE